MRTAIVAIVAAVLGILIVPHLSSLIATELEAADMPHGWRCELGQPVSLGDRPMSEGLARILGQQCADKLRRDGEISRFRKANGAVVSYLVGSIGGLFDPINLILTCLVALGIFLGLKRIILSRKLRVTSQQA
jgi:hypothetical protein